MINNIDATEIWRKYLQYLFTTECVTCALLSMHQRRHLRHVYTHIDNAN